jgi:hypothetical protein
MIMYAKFWATLSLAVGVWFVAASPVLGAERAARGLPTAAIVSVEDVTTIVQSRDMDGQLVEVEVPTQNYSAIRTNGTTQARLPGARGQNERTVPATVVAIDQPANTVKVRTQQNQLLVLQVPTETIASMQMGEKLTLVVPR